MDHPLKQCLIEFQKTGFSRHGKYPNFEAIELVGEGLREELPLTFEAVHKLLSTAKDHWWFAKYWDLPREEVGPLGLTYAFCDLNERNESQVIEELLTDLKHIELVSVILRFVRPDQFGVLSPPVQRILNVTWGSDAVKTYRNYLKNLREIRAEVDFRRVADADMALWVLHAKVFGGEPSGREFRQYYDTDPLLLRIRAENVIGPFGKIPLLPLVRAMQSERSDLAGVAACYLFEIAIRKWAKQLGRKYEGGIKLAEVLDDLIKNGEINRDSLYRWKRLKRVRDDLLHKNIKPEKMQIDEILREIEVIAKTLLSDTHLDEGSLQEA